MLCEDNSNIHVYWRQEQHHFCAKATTATFMLCEDNNSDIHVVLKTTATFFLLHQLQHSCCAKTTTDIHVVLKTTATFFLLHLRNIHAVLKTTTATFIMFQRQEQHHFCAMATLATVMLC